MVKRILGKEIEDRITEESREKLKGMKDKNINPMLAVVGMGDNPDDLSYKRSIKRYVENLGIGARDIALGDDISTGRLKEVVEELNKDEEVSGILILRPFPVQIDVEVIANTIDVRKDIDCMHPLNLIKVFEGNESAFKPCTADAVLKVLLYNGIDLEGKNVVIINRSVVVGKSLAMMLLDEDATVTICHSKTKNLSDITNQADIVVTAMGRADFLTEEYFKEGAIVIDAGIAANDEGKITGDVDFDKVYDKVSKITPVPGGVGRITTSVLISQLLDSIEE